MAEIEALISQCRNCNHSWYPFGRLTRKVLPFSKNVTCPECDHVQKSTWLDDETQKLATQKELGLIKDSNETDNKIKELEKNLELLSKEVELDKKKREILEIQLEKFAMWAQDREEDFIHIETLAEELDDEYKFREDNK